MRSLSLAVAGAFLVILALPAQEPPPTFRSAVDVIAVDVQVVDKDGAPIAGLRPDQFAVTIDGKSRKVVSANLISIDRADEPRAAAPGAARPGWPPDDNHPGRVYILAFDAMSFPALEIGPARDAAHAFVAALRPNDLVGLVVLPEGPTITTTADRGQIFSAIDRIMGRAAPAAMDPFGLTPSEIVDFSRLEDVPANAQDPIPELRQKNPLLVERLLAICTDPDALTRALCIRDVMRDGTTIARFQEAEVSERLGTLRSTIQFLGGDAQHKVVVLVSAGIMSADRRGAGPDLGDVGRFVGQSAAEANCAIYTLFFDRLRLDQSSASRKFFRTQDAARDSAILSRPLEQIAATSGGAFFNITQGGGEFAFDRILKETSAFYLLGVQPAPSDRDGRSHQLKIKVGQKAVTVRGRSWVTLPKPGLSATRPAASSSPAVVPPLAPAPPPRLMPESVREMGIAYARKDFDGFEQQLARTQDLANVLIDLRTGGFPWPDTPRIDRVFALQMALAGLANTNAYARQEGVKLLTRVQSLMERAGMGDPFACAWYVAEAAGLEGLWQPETGLLFVTRASRQCPDEARLSLARAVLLEQQYGDHPDVVQTRLLLSAYHDAARNADAEVEANVRAAWFLTRHSEADQALALLKDPPSATADRYVRYIHALVHGHVLRTHRQIEDAEAAYRQALATAPGAQSARVALMTLLLGHGATDEANHLAEDVLSAGKDAIDPWWTYTRGDFRVYPSLLARLREVAQ